MIHLSGLLTSSIQIIKQDTIEEVKEETKKAYKELEKNKE